ncbi:MAG: hypothetical protein NUW23_13655 [Firmicutes bacterium]|jgi:hypothetical protein|nr:hypothetical protein [Bacillota bacterium]
MAGYHSGLRSCESRRLDFWEQCSAVRGKNGVIGCFIPAYLGTLGIAYNTNKIEMPPGT